MSPTFAIIAFIIIITINDPDQKISSSLVFLMFVPTFALIPFNFTMLKLDSFYDVMKTKTQINKNSLNKYSLLFKRIELINYSQGFFLIVLIIVSITHFFFTNSLYGSFILLYQFFQEVNEANDANTELILLKYGMVASFFLFYGEFLLWLNIRYRNEFLYYYLAKVNFLLIEQTPNKYQELKYLTSGFNYYRKFISQNLKLKIPELNKYYYDIQNSFDSNGKTSINDFVDAFKNEENNELSTLYKLIQYFKEKNIEYDITKTTLKIQITDWIPFITALIPLLIVLLESYFGFLDASNIDTSNTNSQ